ncbi:hypothetical protein VTN77DRAFT_8181 [Rasamsonia byssochlamydoides]|uniref:uncharacterized protein n=1 Tax=Rasamsonia byssochlamydoides TaxID=89139 RepID=UPI003744AE54
MPTRLGILTWSISDFGIEDCHASVAQVELIYPPHRAWKANPRSLFHDVVSSPASSSSIPVRRLGRQGVFSECLTFHQGRQS